MTEHRPPRAILLATDLGARSDRALDRAVLLADQWDAELVVLHVLEDEAPAVLKEGAGLIPSWRRPPDPARAVERRLRADLGDAARRLSVVVESGDTAETILKTAEARGCGLIVTGVARDETLGRFSLGGVVDRLLRRSRIPLLIVRDRARRPYGDIVAATDFSDASRHALLTATGLFPGLPVTLFHAYEAPMAGLMNDREGYEEDWGKAVAADCEAFLKETALAREPKVLIESGAPDELLRDYAAVRDLDLVVLGTHGRSAVFEVLIGNTAKRILAGLPCDALVAREPRAAVEG